MNNLQNKSKAFTLTEAIVTIIVLGIVATIIIGVIKPVDASKEAMMTLAKKTQQNITEAISQMYINDSDFDNIGKSGLWKKIFDDSAQKALDARK